VLDLDIHQLPTTDFDLPAYQKAYILIRYKGIPIGKTLINLHAGRLNIQECKDRMFAAVEHHYLQHWVNDYVGWNERNDVDCLPPTATIAICTRNRTDDLRRCLSAVTSLPDDGQEIIVIDNCPSDNSTENLVSEFPQVRYVLEPKKGLDVARNRALLEAKNEIVAFIDDDAIPDPNWLRALTVNFKNSNVLCVTGLTMPLELETEAQEVFEAYSPFGKGFKRRVFTGNEGNPIATGKIGAGANMAFRKNVINHVGLFDEALDAGTPTQSGGDHEFFARILLAGFSIIYDPAALNWHRHRRTPEELVNVIYGYGVGVYSLLTRHLLVNRDFSSISIAYGWFRSTQWRRLKKAIASRKGSIQEQLIFAELKGCLAGPWAYLKSRKQTRLRQRKYS
jgi:glycosyltransferase involved in cell wall biosynthesis